MGSADRSRESCAVGLGPMHAEGQEEDEGYSKRTKSIRRSWCAGLGGRIDETMIAKNYPCVYEKHAAAVSPEDSAKRRPMGQTVYGRDTNVTGW